MTNAKFKLAAKRHQVSYRERYINPDYNTYVTWLTNSDGKAGKNFYEKLSVFKEVRKRYPEFYVDLYSDMLRSEHIPFNLFVPFKQDLTFCKNVFNEFMNSSIKSIDKFSIIDNEDNIKLEFAPNPKTEYLNDRTAFDTYIEYTHTDNSTGIICIEVKYTEKEYKLDEGSTQAKTIKDKSSKYYSVMKESGLYKHNTTDTFLTDIFRQVWRNHLLAESMRLHPNGKIKHASSLIFYPEGNEHFTETSEKYISMLVDNDNKFIPVTYEKFLFWSYHHCPDKDFEDWLDYLTKRYIVK